MPVGSFYVFFHFICYFKHVTAWIDDRANSPIAKLGVTLEETVKRKLSIKVLAMTFANRTYLCADLRLKHQ